MDFMHYKVAGIRKSEFVFYIFAHLEYDFLVQPTVLRTQVGGAPSGGGGVKGRCCGDGYVCCQPIRHQPDSR